MDKVGIIGTFHILMMMALSISGITVVTSAPIMELPADTSTYISIDGISELLSSPYLKGGNGTQNNPYLFSNIPLGIDGIKIANILGSVQIRNATFDTSSRSIAVDLFNVTDGLVENVTISSHDHLIRSRGKTNLTIDSSRFMDIPDSYNRLEEGWGPLYIDQTGDIVMKDSVLKTRDNGSTYHHNCIFDPKSLYWENCSIDRFMVYLNSKDLDISMVRCTFTNGSAVIPSLGYNGPVKSNLIGGCFFSDSYIDSRDSLSLHITGNRFVGAGSYIVFANTFRNDFGDYNLIKQNAFIGSKGLISLYPAISRWIRNYDITENYFANSSYPAIEWIGEYIFNVRIWKNVFYHTGGTGDQYSGKKQVDIRASGYAYEMPSCNMSVNGVGNYWRDWTGPDSDLDGIVDEPYVIHAGDGGLLKINDEFPSTNPFFDWEGPTIDILEPTYSRTDMEYTVVRWEVFDKVSGVRNVSISMDGKDWKDVTGLNATSFKLKKGYQKICINVTDKANICNRTSIGLEVYEINGPVTLGSPTEGSYFTSEQILMEWEVDPIFVPASQVLKVDGETIAAAQEDRCKTVQLPEGPHYVELFCSDQWGTSFQRRANFTVDLTDPFIEVLTPFPGVEYSPGMMNFRWTIEDRFGLESVRYRTHTGPWTEPSDMYYQSIWSRMEEGDHTLTVEAVDISGRTSLVIVGFTVGNGTVKILEPSERTFSNKDRIEFEWVVSPLFPLDKLELLDLRSGIIINVKGTNSRIVELPFQGENQFTLRAIEPYGNVALDTVTVIKDQDPPMVKVLNDAPGMNRRSLEVEWAGFDTNPIEGYMWRLDGDDWQDVGSRTSTLIDGLVEGEHLFEVLCSDMAGNYAIDEYLFICDLTPPLVALSCDDRTVQHVASISIEWSVTEVNPIANLSLLVGDRVLELSVDVTSWVGVLNDGTTHLVIEVTDIGGNMGRDSVDVLVDTKDPEVEWTYPVPAADNRDRIPLSWTARDNLDVLLVMLEEDDVGVWSGGGGDHDILLEPSEGGHEYSLTAEDGSGRRRTITAVMVVDRTIPELVSIEHSIDGRELWLRWVCRDLQTSVTNVMIDLYGEVHEFSGPNGTIIFNVRTAEDLGLNITVIDKAGNELRTVYRIEAGTSGDHGETGKIWPYVLVAVLLALFCIGGAFLLALWYRKRNGAIFSSSSQGENPVLVLDIGPRTLTVPKGFRSAPTLQLPQNIVGKGRICMIPPGFRSAPSLQQVQQQNLNPAPQDDRSILRGEVLSNLGLERYDKD